jgi:hypothetical protein
MKQPKNLADLGEWPALEIKAWSYRAVRHAYEEVLTACARLSLLASGKTTATYGPINRRQNELAVDDLVKFGIHARRLIEITGTRRRFNTAVVRSRKDKREPADLRIPSIVNKLVHHDSIEIVRAEFQMNLLSKGMRMDELWDGVSESFAPIVLVSTNAGDLTAFELQELIETFQQKVLGPIIEICQEQGLYLDDVDND